MREKKEVNKKAVVKKEIIKEEKKIIKKTNTIIINTIDQKEIELVKSNINYLYKDTKAYKVKGYTIEYKVSIGNSEFEIDEKTFNIIKKEIN